MSKTVNLECKECGNQFEYMTRRGRPPVKCLPCRELPKKLKRPDVTKKLSSVEIVDRLEMALKANGNHISQWRDKWE